MKISLKLIACLFMFCLLGATSYKQKTYKISARSFNLAKTEKISGFKMCFINGDVRTFSNVPSDWKIVLDNWDEDDQRHWTGSIKGNSGHFSSSLRLSEFLEIFVIMEATEPGFNLKLDIYAEDQDGKRTIKLTKKQLLITPLSMINPLARIKGVITRDFSRI
jgi:hypothetical protein